MGEACKIRSPSQHMGCLVDSQLCLSVFWPLPCFSPKETGRPRGQRNSIPGSSSLPQQPSSGGIAAELKGGRRGGEEIQTQEVCFLAGKEPEE
jgi:hypothetical protein